MEVKRHDQMILKCIQMKKYQRTTRKSLKKKQQIRDKWLWSSIFQILGKIIFSTSSYEPSVIVQKKFSYMNASRKCISPTYILKKEAYEPAPVEQGCYAETGKRFWSTLGLKDFVEQWYGWVTKRKILWKNVFSGTASWRTIEKEMLL